MELNAVILADVWAMWMLPFVELIIGLGLVIFVHELGHFLVAKAVGIKVERFSLGFGPRVWGFTKGETEYRLSALPLGGYVKMLGQEDFKPLEPGQGDPHAFNNKPIWARFLVVSAGVVMNVLFAGILFIIVCLMGIQFPAAVVGGTLPGYPAASAEITWDQPIPAAVAATIPASSSAPATTSAPAATPETVTQSKGLKPGDEILSVNGKRTVRWQSVAVRSILAHPDNQFTFRIRRKVDGHSVEGTALVGVRKDPTGGKPLSFGMMNAFDPVIETGPETRADSPFKKGDRILAIDGRPAGDVGDYTAAVAAIDRSPVTLTLDRPGETAPVSLSQPVKVLGGTPDNLLTILGLSPRVLVFQVTPGTPAANAGFEPGDILYNYGDLGGAPTFKQLKEASARYAGKGANIVLLRKNKVLPPVWVVPREPGRKGSLGFVSAPDYENLVVAGVDEGSPAAKDAKGNELIKPGDQIEGLNGQAVGTWQDLFFKLQGCFGQEVVLTVRRNSRTFDAPLGALTKEMFNPADYEKNPLTADVEMRTVNVTIQITNPLGAVAWGANEAWDFTLDTYVSLHRLFSGTVPPDEIRGPLGIGSAAIKMAQTGFAHIVYFFAIISISLAVINFLPIPVVDGGHVVFLAFEKFRGKPISVKVMNVAQVAGLALLLAVFVYATRNDILRWFKGQW